MTTLWKRWQKITIKIAGIQANIVLFFIFYLILVPLGFLLKSLFPSVLLGHKYKKKKNSYWIQYKKITYDMEFARKQ